MTTQTYPPIVSDYYQLCADELKISRDAFKQLYYAQAYGMKEDNIRKLYLSLKAENRASCLYKKEP